MHEYDKQYKAKLHTPQEVVERICSGSSIVLEIATAQLQALCGAIGDAMHSVLTEPTGSSDICSVRTVAVEEGTNQMQHIVAEMVLKHYKL